jgi:isoleucyl-tRNA synthetase
MKFKSGTRRKALEYEKDIVQYWQENNVFNKSVKQRNKNNTWVFYDGPPFLTGTPHHGHLLISAVKDTMGRFHTMQGQRVERRWGWDCHGLPAELFVEKKLGIANKKEVGLKISVEDYVKECRAVMVKTGTEWEDTIDRIGRWVEFKGAYQTMDKEYMESVWWAFKELYDKGKIYDGEKILVYCTKDATPISKSEVAMENSYQTVTDPSVFVFFELETHPSSVLLEPGTTNQDPIFLLAWTTTPWTLPANVALAINSDVEYSLINHDGKKFYIATEAIERVMTDEKHQSQNYSVITTTKGSDLVGLKYHPLFENHGVNSHIVLNADFVTTEDGTGIVHEAPAYGEEDYELCRAENIPIVSIVDENGIYTSSRWQGENIWDVNKLIAKTLVEEGKALKVEYIQHEYPHCHRCGNKLMYRAHPSWFLDVQGQKEEMLLATDDTSWTPRHLQTGRFRNIIESAPDWNLSRDRFWATPIPVWKGERNDGTTVVKVFGSYAEFEEYTGQRLDDYHLPQVMNITFELDGTTMHHIGKVLDCWFESGSMPFAQFHYPFENKDTFERSYPADFIVEAIDQTRGWFYALMAVNVGLFGKAPFKNLICTGFINAADGKKMAKKLKNYTDPMELMDKYSADSFRFLMMSSPLTNGEDFALADKDVADTARKLSMIWNVYDFFTLYAEVDNWEWDGKIQDHSDKCKNVLDIWIMSKIHTLIYDVNKATQEYDLQSATRLLLPFIDDLSNWYVRRSRKRFWKSDDDSDKQVAYKTLHYVLVQLAHVIAPFTPFLAEELFQKLTGEESVHLRDWPEVGNVDETLVGEMDAVRHVVNEGLSLRAKNQIKVRQPLSSISVTGMVSLGKNTDLYLDILKEELNVKQVNWGTDGEPTVELDVKLTNSLIQEGLAREVVRLVQNARKEARLDVDDRITLTLATDSKELQKAILEYSSYICSETLTTLLDKTTTSGHSSEHKINDYMVQINLKKAH